MAMAFLRGTVLTAFTDSERAHEHETKVGSRGVRIGANDPKISSSFSIVIWPDCVGV